MQILTILKYLKVAMTHAVCIANAQEVLSYIADIPMILE